MNNKLMFIVCACVCALCATTSAQETSIPRETVNKALGCITKHEFAFKKVPAFSELKSLRVAYSFGKLDAADKSNELHIMIYGSGEASAMVYEVLVKREQTKESFSVVNVGVFVKVNGAWSLNETNGGTYSYARMQQLIDRLSAKKPFAVERARLEDKNSTCVPF